MHFEVECGGVEKGFKRIFIILLIAGLIGSRIGQASCLTIRGKMPRLLHKELKLGKGDFSRP
ncbi:MAG: hypothetical protein A2042_00045 [Candidatus Schekmanbacteria bacterium GWA2_38_11]|uniref:Uncharacterized protein n=1 Tax=Candidatus Schekmanbacteria bacterium GWA2_38_11 TaxID=1817876 RepID=A0A1F7RQF1_9BACT|nr:MAG: hypothetical protein A2042_00045 [Candidatus Schekmanbacteria bacterium GWA2_38_11]